MKLITSFCFLLTLSAACSEDVDPESLSVSILDYETWDKMEPLLGPVPGHGESYRLVYRNELARSYTGAGEYPLGSAVVKEIYALGGQGEPGKLRYKAVMRRMDSGADENQGLPITGGWLFTQIDSGTEEFQRDLCWDSCHKSAPFLGAFLDHGY